jgi:hypothetical protein
VKKEFNAFLVSLSVALTVGTLVALADSYEWETQLNGLDVELKGSAEQVHSAKIQKECVSMAKYAIEQFKANGGVITPKSHEIECQVGTDGHVSALLERDSDCEGPSCLKNSNQPSGVSAFQDAPQPASDISAQP